MSEPDYVLGIDIAKETFDVELLGTSKPHSARIANTPAGYAMLSAMLVRQHGGMKSHLLHVDEVEQGACRSYARPPKRHTKRTRAVRANGPTASISDRSA